MQICFRLALNLWRKVKRGVFLAGNTCIADRANRFFYPSKKKKISFRVSDVFSSFPAAVPEAGDLLRREGPGLLDAVCLMAEERE